MIDELRRRLATKLLEMALWVNPKRDRERLAAHVAKGVLRVMKGAQA